MGPWEGVFLSAPHQKECLTANGLNAHKFWCIVVLTHMSAIAKCIVAKMLKGKNEMAICNCCICKNKCPTFFKGNMLNTFCDALFQKKKMQIFAKLFLAGVIEMCDNSECEDHIRIDIHFNDDMVNAVREINKVHFKFTKGHACQLCGFKEIMELPNAIEF